MYSTVLLIQRYVFNLYINFKSILLKISIVHLFNDSYERNIAFGYNPGFYSMLRDTNFGNDEHSRRFFVFLIWGLSLNYLHLLHLKLSEIITIQIRDCSCL